MPLLQHIILTGSTLALAGAGWRLAAATGGAGLGRVLAAAAFAGAAAVIETLLLGLAGLSGSTVTLGLAAAGTWLAARLALAHPGRPAAASSPGARESRTASPG